jgi:hypothetical protein
MSKTKQETAPICVRVPRTRLEWLKRLARARAVEQDRDVEFTELVREALDKVFPMEAGAK